MASPKEPLLRRIRWIRRDASGARVVVANPADGGVLYWLGKLYGFTLALAALALVLTVVLVYRSISASAPPTPDLRTYADVAPSVSRIYAADGTLLGEFAREFRTITPYDRIPEPLVQAFLAVEDHDYFQHGGIYFKGIARAAWANVTAGDFAQGGSTITQQVAKQFLGAEKSLTRKAKEAVMARRLEARYSKKAILAVYLNHIYLGAGAYGVAGAAQRYFQKDLDELTLAEAALLAGLAQAPSRFSPVRNPEGALERRNVVLDRMARYGFAPAADVEAAKREPITLRMYRDVFPDRMPYSAEEARRYVERAYGKDALPTRGFRVETAAEPTFEAAAYDSVDYMARRQDKRQGWRGPEWYLGDQAARDLFVARQRELYGAGALDPTRRYLALVESVTDAGARLRVADRELTLPLRNMSWAAPWRAGRTQPNDQTITTARRTLKPGDVVWVRREVRTRGRFRAWTLDEKLNPQWLSPRDERAWDEGNPDVVVLEQTPHPQVAIFNADHRTGYVTAMVGGHDFTRSVFNRAVQACRTPASAFKPIYYSMALEDGYGYDTVLPDEKLVIKDPVTGVEHTPKNIFDDLDGDVSLEYALVFSKNIPSIDLFRRLGGAKAVEPWTRRLGFTTPFNLDLSMALGSSCTYLHELTRAFAIFARNGRWVDWVFVRRILDRDGNLVEDNTVAWDPMLSPGDRLDRLYALADHEPPQAIAARTAVLITRLLVKMVDHGLTKTVRQTEIKAAGKTGTSDETLDTQFVAFTSRLITLVWAGDDERVRTLGKDDAAYITIVPLWARFMWEAARDFPNEDLPWNAPASVPVSDRGDHAKGTKGARMTLVRTSKEKALAAEGLGPGAAGGGGGGGE